jgi:mRNA interferase MazF
MSLTNNAICRGDIFLVNLDPVKGSEQGKTRPCVVIQNDLGNQYSPVTIIACITSNIERRAYPTNVFITAKETDLDHDSLVILNQIRTVDKSRLIKKLGIISEAKMLEVDAALKISLGL